MNKLLTWLKAKVRGWCAPDYPRLHDAFMALHKAQVEADRDRDLLMEERDTNARLLELLRVPFEARESESAPAWTNDDAGNWRKFLGSETGQKFRQSLNYWSQLQAQTAALRLDKHEYACGLAAGWHNEGDFILNKLSADLPLQTEGDTEQGKGAAGYRERVAP